MPLRMGRECGCWVQFLEFDRDQPPEAALTPFAAVAAFYLEDHREA